MATAKAFITGVAGPRLAPGERSFLRDERPWGLILFARNIREPAEVFDLVAEFRDCVGSARAAVLIDQEGGRVQRLKAPHWRRYPAGRAYGALYRRDPEEGLAAARLVARLMAEDLTRLGINVDCLPVLDVPVAGAHDVIGDRAYGDDLERVTLLGRAAADGLLDGGVLPIVKHIPGHGRAGVDSHLRLPVVDTPRHVLEETDFAAFRTAADLPLAMTAHVVYSAIDDTLPATTSPVVVDEIIRGFIGFDGCLMGDDVSMQALEGTIEDRVLALFDAGCDLALHCNGQFDEMRAVADRTPELAGRAGDRADAALGRLVAPREFDRDRALAFVEDLTRAAEAAA